jgi:alpha-L-arabinofuranosidase
MKSASLTIDPAFRIGDIDPRLFGSFVEHLGRCVYGGIYQPGHPSADDNGFRQDVLELVRELGPTIVRYPGGNFVSAYDWEDGIGPAGERPRRLDLAWHTIETNEIGIDEFATWSKAAGTDVCLTVNLGTRGVDAARNLVEYCNHPGDTYWSELRVKNGHPAPHDVKLWCLGNEMDGPWQIGAKTAAEYGPLARETAKAMKLVDPSIELVACGSSNLGMSTFAGWEATVLEHTYEYVDYVSLHNYYESTGDVATFLARSLEMEAFIDSVVSTADFVKAKLRSKKRIDLTFDEWNVWYHSQHEGPPARWKADWTTESSYTSDVYSHADALVVGCLLSTLLRHADRMKIACQAQLVNVLAPIIAPEDGAAWRQTIFHPFAHVARYARGVVLRTEPVSDGYNTEEHGEVPSLECAVTLDAEKEELVVFAVNRGTHDELSLEATLVALPGWSLVEHIVMDCEDPHARNSPEIPDAVAPRRAAGGRVQDGILEVSLPPLSWNVIRLGASGHLTTRT